MNGGFAPSARRQDGWKGKRGNILYYKVKSVDGWEIEVKLLLFLSYKPPSTFLERNELSKPHFLADHGTVCHGFFFGSGRLSNHKARDE